MQSKILDENYINIQGWMINKLNLKGSELIIFAIIYGFSQDGQSQFTGSLQYLAEWTNTTKQNCMNQLKSLLDKKFIEKEEFDINNMKFCKYKINFTTMQNFCIGSKNFCIGSKNFCIGSKNFCIGSKNFCTNNINNNINNNKLNNINNINIINKENSGNQNFPNNIIDDLNLKNIDFDNYKETENYFEEEKPKKKKVLSSKQKNKLEVDNIVQNYSTNPEVTEALKVYVDIRRKKGLTAEQLRIILEDLHRECKNNDEYTIQCIRQATARGWMSIIYNNNFTGSLKTHYSSNGFKDNTDNHNKSKDLKDMTEEEKQYFYDHELARDENGNLMKF